MISELKGSKLGQFALMRVCRHLILVEATPVCSGILLTRKYLGMIFLVTLASPLETLILIQPKYLPHSAKHRSSSDNLLNKYNVMVSWTRFVKTKRKSLID